MEIVLYQQNTFKIKFDLILANLALCAFLVLAILIY